MAFDPKRHVIKVQGGRLYLPVSARLVWFREEHPDWGIATEIIEINPEKQYAIFRASIFNEEGRLIASATKKEDVKGFGDFIEKAETGSVGRALALCGYGAQFEPELGDGGGFGGGGGMRSAPGPRFEANRPAPGGPPQRLAPPTPSSNGGAPRPSAPPRDELPPPPDDAFAAAPPREAPRPAPAERPQDRPAPPRPQAPPARPAPVAARPHEDDDELPPPPDLDSLGLKPASAVSRPAPRPLPPPTEERPREAARPAPARPAPTGARVERVREPERDLVDPGGEGDDFDDPFADEDAPPSPPARPATAARRPAPRSDSSDRLL